MPTQVLRSVEFRWRFVFVCSLLISALLLLSFTTLIIFGTQQASAAQSIPYKLNFQGRLTDNAGNIRPDGLYNMQFKIYDASTAGTLLWSETRETTARVQVTNGLFSTQLGDVTSLPPSIFNNPSPRHFEITLATPATATCSTAACATWESPMTPRQTLASAAYAMNADTIDGIDGANIAQLNQNNTFTGTNLVKTTSTTAVRIQNSGGTDLFVADTSAMKVTVANLKVDGQLEIAKVKTTGPAPTVLRGTAVCGTPTPTIAGNDTAGTVSMTNGTCGALGGNSGTGMMFNVTFNSAYGTTPRILVSPTTDASGALSWYVNSSTTGFSIGTASAYNSGAVVSFNYWVVE